MRSQAAAAALAFRYRSCRALGRAGRISDLAGFALSVEKTSLHPSLRRRMAIRGHGWRALCPRQLAPIELEPIDWRVNSHRPPTDDAGDYKRDHHGETEGHTDDERILAVVLKSTAGKMRVPVAATHATITCLAPPSTTLSRVRAVPPVSAATETGATQ